MTGDVAASPRTYRLSALASALMRMWRAWTVIVPVVVGNAIVQALLVWPASSMDRGWALVLAALVSAVAFALAFGLVATAALLTPDGRVSCASALSGLRAHRTAYGLWALGLLIAVSIALAVQAAAALVVLAVTPFLLLAAIDGRPNPLMVNMRTIGRRFWRWLGMCVIVGGAVVLGTVFMGVTQFFLRGSFGALVAWLVGGLVLSWFTVAWALVYRNAWAPDLDEQDPARILGEKATRGGAAR